MVEMKQCALKDKCNHPEKQGDGWLPATSEFFGAARNDGLRNQCREEARIYARERYWKAPEKHRERTKTYAAANPDKVHATAARSRNAHRDRVHERNVRFYRENVEEQRARSQTYRRSHPDKVREQHRLYIINNHEKVVKHRRIRYIAHREGQIAYSMAYYREHREERLQYNRDNADTRREKRNLYYQDPSRREAFRKKNAEYRATHREQSHERSRLYNQTHRVEKRVSLLKYRTLKRSLPHQFTVADWQRALDYFNGCCAVCGRQLHDLFGTHTAAGDHWIPLSSPNCPGTIPTNMLPLCHGQGGCNSRKFKRDPVEFLEAEFGKRRAAEILARVNTYFEWVKSQEAL